MPVETARFWLIRHALVHPAARMSLYGTEDVPVCEETMAAQAPAYAALGRRLPTSAQWLVTPLSRTRRTAEAIFGAGYPARPLAVEPAFIEQSFGALQGSDGASLAAKLRLPPHDFWPISEGERPEGGESFEDVIIRVGAALERLARERPGGATVAVCHGGTIRAAVAHVLQIGGAAALRLSVGNISLTRIERHGAAWRVIAVNETVEGLPAL